jgi:quercetin dioxygenase-like cupin family protein
MMHLFIHAFGALAVLAIGENPGPTALQPHLQPHHVACTPVNGHEGQPGCWELGNIPISAAVGTPLFWHVYEFPTVAEAQQARDDRSQVITAYGRAWLEAVADKGWKPRGGHHVATVGPMYTMSSLPQTASFMEATFTPGMRSRVHTHAGPEAWVVLEGEQCLETIKGKIRVQAGESMMVRGGIPMALYGTGKGIRRALVLIIHPTGQSLGTTYDGWQPTESCLRSADKKP